VADATLFLFDGYNLLHAGGYADARELADALAGFVAMRGARGIVVFDGAGADRTLGPLEVRYAPDADTLLERLAAQHRDTEHVVLVSSDEAVRGTSGVAVAKVSSAAFLDELPPLEHTERLRSELVDRLDADTLAKLERLRRGRS
jgi:predicted RNA-binding protein with PIN domain